MAITNPDVADREDQTFYTGPEGNGTTITGPIGFYGASPVAQRAGAAQAAVATTAATSTSPWGYSEAQANAIVTLVNELRAALVAVGIIKGGA